MKNEDIKEGKVELSLVTHIEVDRSPGQVCTDDMYLTSKIDKENSTRQNRITNATAHCQELLGKHLDFKTQWVG